jgi:hypothetical protein
VSEINNTEPIFELRPSARKVSSGEARIRAGRVRSHLDEVQVATHKRWNAVISIEERGDQPSVESEVTPRFEVTVEDLERRTKKVKRNIATQLDQAPGN